MAEHSATIGAYFCVRFYFCVRLYVLAVCGCPIVASAADGRVARGTQLVLGADDSSVDKWRELDEKVHRRSDSVVGDVHVHRDGWG